MILIHQLRAKPLLFRIFRFSKSGSFPKLLSSASNNSSEKIRVPLGSSAPVPPDEDDCCNEGCQDCVWIKYVNEMKLFYKDDKAKLKEACDLIPAKSVKEFVKLELKSLFEKS